MSVGVSFHHNKQRFCGTSWKHSHCLIFATRMNKSVNAPLHAISCQGKVSLFMLVLLIGFAGK